MAEKDDAETRRARAEAKEMAEQKRNERLYEGSLSYPSSAPMVTKAKGGTASSRADGIAQRGKTKGTMVAMCGGGRMKK